jgi:hypothetical protein
MTVDTVPQVADVLVILEQFGVQGGWAACPDDPMSIEPTTPVTAATVFSTAHIAQAWETSTGCRPVSVCQTFALDAADEAKRAASWRIRFEAVR